ncbi:hypothetical protein BVRB_2g039440 [Beta vulgaris subsp. vulgaris]|nr:hypothetical protein BVRB_2g039440 [Beta vulgaris subsp. vulgaris]
MKGPRMKKEWETGKGKILFTYYFFLKLLSIFYLLGLSINYQLFLGRGPRASASFALGQIRACRSI